MADQKGRENGSAVKVLEEYRWGEGGGGAGTATRDTDGEAVMAEEEVKGLDAGTGGRRVDEE